MSTQTIHPLHSHSKKLPTAITKSHHIDHHIRLFTKMALGLQIEKEFTHSSARVKSLDLHPTQPWILAGLHSGTVFIWNYESQTVVKSIQVSDKPVRSAKFIAPKQWLVIGADDGHIHIYDYGTMEKVKEVEAHGDFIRSLVVHPTLPFVLSCSDDKLIKLWEWEKDWACFRVFEGHAHYVMQAAFNPKDPETFATASLDATVKIWNFGSSTPIATLEAHSKGVNCVEYFPGDKPYLISGSDDCTAKVWDYETKTCVQTLEGHTDNVTAAHVHPDLPIIVTGSEDTSVRIWNAITKELENTLNYGVGRAWGVRSIEDSQRLVIAYDEGIILVNINLGAYQPS